MDTLVARHRAAVRAKRIARKVDGMSRRKKLMIHGFMLAMIGYQLYVDPHAAPADWTFLALGVLVEIC